MVVNFAVYREGVAVFLVKKRLGAMFNVNYGEAFMGEDGFVVAVDAAPVWGLCA